MSTEKSKHGAEKLQAIPNTMQPWINRGMRLVHPAASKYGEYVLVGCQSVADDTKFQHQILVIDEAGRPLPGIRIVVAFPNGSPIGMPAGQSYWNHGESDLRGVKYTTDDNGRTHHTAGATGGERIWIWDIDAAGDLKLASVKVEGCAVVDTQQHHNKGVQLTFQRRRAESASVDKDKTPGTIRINGPYWSAEGQMLSAPVPGETAERSVMARLLFVDRETRQIGELSNAFLPGTLLALCYIRSVEIRPDDGFVYRWQRPVDEQVPNVLTSEAIQDAVRTGTAALLVLRGDPDELARGVATFDCLSGEISLDGMQPQNHAIKRLFDAVGLEQPEQPAPTFAQRRGISVHASGLSLYARVQLPWEAQPLTLPFQVAQMMPSRGHPAFRLTIEADRLTAGEERLTVRSWRRLSGYLNPKHPLNEFPATPDSPGPIWLTLELTNPLAIPRLFWEIAPWKDKTQLTALKIEPAETNLLLSDQQPYDRANPAVSLAHVSLQAIEVKKVGAGLQVTAEANSANPAGKGSIAFDWDLANRQEIVSFKEMEVGFEPVQTADFLRELQGRPAPEWLPEVDQPQPIAQPILWGFMPLEDGWAELPFLNLTAQIFLDAEVGPQDPPTTLAPFLLQGAAAIGNDHEVVLRHYRDEQPWNMTLTDAQEMNGTWSLRAVDGGYQLEKVQVSFTGPEAIFNGLFWLGAARATAEDALPDLTDWVSGLQSIPLKTVDPAFDLFPPPVLLKLSDFAFALRDAADNDRRRPSAQMTTWSFSFQINPLAFDLLVAKKVIPEYVFTEPRPTDAEPFPSPLLWRRHPTLPMIQALPLTQSKNPPTFPGASRQFAPFQMSASPFNWTFYVTGTNAARRWPEFRGDLLPADEWAGEANRGADLPLVALSLPGLVLEPGLPDGSGLGKVFGLNLPAQYRFDLPYLDQIMALAQTPKMPRDANEVSPLPDQEPPQAPQPLERAAYADYWKGLSGQAGLASADAVEAFLLQAAIGALVEHLIEPYRWAVNPTAAIDAYPGSLTLEDASTGAQYNLLGETALKGISGHFVLDADGDLHLSNNGAGPDSISVDAGSMAAYPQNGGFRDQRGLFRLATTHVVGGQLLQTPVQFEREPNVFDHYLLTSTLTPLDLALTGDAATLRWRFWFRDLPVNAAMSVFDRQEVTSSEAKVRDLDINDPEALSREYNYRQGYEWRLGTDAQQTEYLDLGGLRFYPLALESVRLTPSEKVDRVILTGRLQLPLGAESELIELSNAVQLSFIRTTASGDLQLGAVDLVSPVGEWPLALTENNETADAPLLLWGKIALKQADATSTTAKSCLEVSDVRLRFFLFDVEWTLPLDEPLVFNLDGGNPESIRRTYVFDNDETKPIYPQKVDTILALDRPYKHVCDFYLDVQIGSRVVDGLAARYTFHQGIDEMLVYDVSGVEAPLNLAIMASDGVFWTETGLDIRQPIAATTLRYHDTAPSFVKALRDARELSVELWVTPNAAVTAPILVLNQGGQPGFRLSQAAGQIQIRLGADDPLTGTLPDAQPVHIVYTRDGWQRAHLYIDGREVSAIASPTDFGAWDTDIQLALANDVRGGSPWRGQFHSLSLSHRALSGDEVSYRYTLGPGARATRSALRTEIKCSLLVEGAAVAHDQVNAEVQETALFEDIPILLEEQILFQGNSLQFRWDTYRFSADRVLYLLPGLELSADNAVQGFAALTFEAMAGFTLDSTSSAALASLKITPPFLQVFAAAGFPLSSQATIEANGADEWMIRSRRQRFSVHRLALGRGEVYRVIAGAPALRLTMVFMETMLTCSWGESLQDPHPAPENDLAAPKAGQKAKSPLLEAFGSSAGDVLFNYTVRLQTEVEAGAHPWEETLLLNGMVEITNLLSWPLAMNQANGQLRLPALRARTELDHLRHTIRILLNQHEIPPGMLVAGEGPLIFSFAGRNAWQFLAVVEHQLVDTHLLHTNVEEEANWEAAYDHDRRWAALQEVRWASPRAFSAFLDHLSSGEIVNPFDSTTQSTLTISTGGDDVNEDGSAFYADQPLVWLGTGDKADRSFTGLRFNNVAIPQGAAILSARLRVVSQPKSEPSQTHIWVRMNFEIAAEVEDDSSHFSATNRPSKRRLTTARVRHESNDKWDYATAYELSDEIAPIIQEVVDRPGWRNGNALALILRGMGDRFGRKFVLSREVGKAGAIQLSITYSVPARNPYSHGYFNPAFRTLLDNGAIQQLPPDVLLVEASAPHWIKRVATRNINATTIQYLPFGAQAAILTSPDDFKTSRINPPADGADWLLLTMPFIGRMQPTERDIPDPKTQPYPLQLDPILELAPFVTAPADQAAPALPLALANWADGTEAILTLLDFDTYIGRIFPRLDPLSLEENWFRLQNPLTESMPPGLRSIAAALPPTPGRLSRSLALRRAADSFRLAYPPALIEVLPPKEQIAAGFVWRQDSLMVLQSSTVPTPQGGVPYAWHFIGWQAIQGLQGTASATTPRDLRALRRQRHAAATLIPTPARLKREGELVENRTPVSFAVSPYLGLELLYAGVVNGGLNEDTSGGLRAGELLCSGAGALRPVASYIWEKKKTDQGSWQDMAWDKWARETHQRLAADSPVAVLRFREIHRTGDGAEAPVAVSYNFQLVTGLTLRLHLNQRSHRVRSAVKALRFRQGQYGGRIMPTDLHAFELAAPQTSGLQPIYLTHSLLPDESWPWGVSGLRVSVQYTQDQRAVLNIAPTQEGGMTLWWQAPALAVQFRSAERSERRAASLPRSFRAPAIKSFLPVLPNPPMPKVGDEQLGTVEDIDLASTVHGKNGWQSVLPGSLRYLVTGSRAGVMFALRNALIRQQGVKRGAESVGETVVSGSVPAQHRFPRPVPLPRNHRASRGTALQPWASYFEPEQNALVTHAPADEVFFAAFRPKPDQPETLARRLRLILRTPGYGAVPPDWNGELVFDVATDQPVPRLESWQFVESILSDSSSGFPLRPPTMVSLMDLPAQAITEGQPIMESVRERLVAENLLAREQNACFYRDGRWSVIVNPGANEIALAVYEEDGGLRFVTSDSANGQIPQIVGESEQRLTTIRTDLINGDALSLVSVIREKLGLTDIPMSQVRQHWLIADRPGGQILALLTPQEEGFSITSLRLRFTFEKPDDSEILTGSGLAFCVRVRHWQTTPGFDLTLRFPLTAVDQSRLPLPLEPYYVHFEDPEYNRQLASNAAHATQIVKDRLPVENDKLQEIAHTVTLAADRKEYNADSEIALRFDWDDDRREAVATSLEVVRLTPDSGSSTPLPLNDATSAFHAGELRRYSLSALAASAKIALGPGDKVRITVKVKGQNSPADEDAVPIVLELLIVEEIVTPGAQAGYALLRFSTLVDGDDTRQWVECARFAWTPVATRVEMVCAEDLRTEIVRRRAVFQWRDTARPNREVREAIQKITLSGATHFPWSDS